jgi:type IV pilus assembly protein PilQ
MTLKTAWHRTVPTRKRSEQGIDGPRIGLVLLLTLSCLALAGWLPRVRAETLTLDKVTYASLPGERVQLRLTLSGAAHEPLSFAIDDPARIALDFPGVAVNLPRKSQPIGVGMARSVTAVEAGGRTRVVLNLVKLVPYTMQVQGNEVLLTLENEATGGTQPFAGTTSTAASPAGGLALENVDFRRGKRGEGRVIVTLSDPSIVIDTREEGGKIIVEFLNTKLPSRLQRKLDVVDFATPVTLIDTYAQGDNVRMEVSPTGRYEHLAYQSDDLFTLEVKPVTEVLEEAKKKKKEGYTGERLSLNFQNIEVRAVLQLLADFTGLNLVASDTVTGNVTLRLKNVPWDQALDIILKARGLGMRQVGNVIMVAPTEEIAAREKLELEANKQIEELAPLQTEFIQVNYAKAGELAGLLKAKENSLMSARGSVSIDARTNTLLVRDTTENLAAIRRMVSTLDIPVRQVLIESRIVIADDKFSRDLGVRWGYNRTSSANSISDGATYEATGTLTSLRSGIGSGSPANDFVVDLPVADPTAALGVAVGKIGSWMLQAELSVLQQEGRGEVISNPRVITANQKEAVIEQGTEIPYQEASSSGATSTSFKKAVLSLRVTPQITPDDRVIMDLEVNKDSVGATFGGVPSVDTRSVSTQVLVDNGETVVLGGIYESNKRQDVERVPLFSDIPVLGWAFRRTETQDDKEELLIFITPRLLKESLAVR